MFYRFISVLLSECRLFKKETVETRAVETSARVLIAGKSEISQSEAELTNLCSLIGGERIIIKPRP